MSKLLRSLFAATLLATIAVGLVGCVDPENQAQNPWNPSGNFQSGQFSPSMNEGR